MVSQYKNSVSLHHAERNGLTLNTKWGQSYCTIINNLIYNTIHIFFSFSFFIFSSLVFLLFYFFNYTHPLGNRDNTTWYQILTKKKVTPKITQINKNIQLLKHSNIKPPQFSFSLMLGNTPNHPHTEAKNYVIL